MFPPQPNPPADSGDTPDAEAVRRSPIRPQRPDTAPLPPLESVTPPPAPPAAPPAPTDALSDPEAALTSLRRKIEAVADEFAQGKINRAQFNAVYKRYSEQRTIIERLIERNPDSDAWKQVVAPRGQTGFLRSQFAAQPRHCAIYPHEQAEALVRLGSRDPDRALVLTLLQRVWQMPSRPKQAMGRKELPTGEWLILVVGDFTTSVLLFSLEPSIAQARWVRDLHADFERANQILLARGWLVTERMVFPQRALFETP